MKRLCVLVLAPAVALSACGDGEISPPTARDSSAIEPSVTTNEEPGSASELSKTLEGVVSIDAHPSGTFACALSSVGVVHCWGGLAPAPHCEIIQSGSSPRRVPGLVDATQLAVGPETAFAVRESGEVVTWGRGAFARGLVRSSGSGQLEIEEGAYAGLQRRWAVGCWFECENQPISTRICTQGDLVGALCVSSAQGVACDRSRELGRSHDAALLDHALTWNSGGPGLSGGAKTVEGACVLLNSGEVRCSAFPDDPHPMSAVPLPGKAVDLSFEDAESGFSYLAALNDGGIYRWEIAADGGPNHPPRKVATVPGARQVEAARGTGWGDVCVLSNSGEVSCFFESGAGGSIPADCRSEREGSATVSGLPPTKQLAASRTSICALGDDGRVRCWGLAQGFGTVGRGDTKRDTTNYVCTPRLLGEPLPDTRVGPVLADEPLCASLSDATKFVAYDAGTLGAVADTEPETKPGRMAKPSTLDCDSPPEYPAEQVDEVLPPPD